MSEPILWQLLGVSWSQAGKGHGQESLLYNPSVVGADGPAPDLYRQHIKGWSTIRSALDQIRNQVQDMVRRALVGQTRSTCDIGPASRELAAHVLPVKGIAGLLSPGLHPQFDIVPDKAAEIPWEVLEEPWPICPVCQQTPVGYDPARADYRFCPIHREELRPAGGKLALKLHLTHLARGAGRPARGDQGGRYFLFVEDPCGDLCHPERDRSHICRDHLPALRDMVERAGFKLHILAGQAATCGRLRQAIGDPDVAGIYYFGHGYFPKDGDGGFLVAADGDLPAADIAAAGPAARFVFLNACEGAALGANWELEKRCGNVAEAFARGGGKVVIAPLWPVVNAQAAQSAMEFFKHAAEGPALAESLMHVRRESLARYQNDQPDLSWMAYRYFGDPNRRLAAQPAPPRRPPATAGALCPPVAAPVFREDGALATEMFSFDIDGVLMRAASRRNSQHRQHVGVSDFVAGLIRRGDLTRYVLTRLRVNADKLYQQLLETEDTDKEVGAEVRLQASEKTSGPSPEPETLSPSQTDDEQNAVAQIRRLLAKLIVRQRRDFSDEMNSVLSRAGELAHRRAPESPTISERCILEALTESPAWRKVPHIPEGFRSELLAQPRESWFDDNGQLVLRDLDAASRKVIESAHVFAQQRGVCPITHRLMLAALLEDAQGHAARAFAAAGTDPKTIFRIMLAASEEKQRKPQRTFGLSHEACQRIVGPMIGEARRRAVAHSAPVVTDRDLFVAFCAVASPAFKENMRHPPLPFDLDQLAQASPESAEPAARFEVEASEGAGPALESSSFDEDAWQAVVAAEGLARSQGCAAIRSPHLLASLLDADAASIRSIILGTGLSPTRIRKALMAVVRSTPQPPAGPSRHVLSGAAYHTLQRAIQRGMEQRQGRASSEDLLVASLSDEAGIVGRLLRELPVAEWLRHVGNNGGRN